MASRLYFYIREKIRMNPLVSRLIYVTQNAYFSLFGRLRPFRAIPAGDLQRVTGVALCLRFRDEAPFLDEWLTYHRAAGVAHFFLYNNFSQDDYAEALRPHLERGYLTLIDWPYKPASPAAEEDCVRRSASRFQWLGFLDTDEFLVIRDGRSVEQFLADYTGHPAVALHWLVFGSNGHKQRPRRSVTQAYTRRESRPNTHLKCFVQPSQVTQNRNPHSWYYRHVKSAVNEHKRPVYGSLSRPPSADGIWINHYYCKSEEDYLQKAQRASAQDRVGIKFPTRRLEKLERAMRESNEVFDDSAVAYYRARSATLAPAERHPG